MKQEFLTPVGRLVQGGPFEAQTTNMQGQPLVTQSGQPTQRYFIAVAFPKMVNGQPNQEFAKLWALLDACARGSFPALNILPPWDPNCRFSWKVADGDGVDDNGKPNANKEGFAGHWVVKFSSSFAPRCFHAGHYQPHEQIQDPKTIKRGYFVRVSGSIEGNGNAQKPGIYVNLGMVELAGQGPEIVSGPDASAVFGASAPVLPAGASPLPMHAAGGLPTGLPGMAPQPAAMPTVGLPQMPGMAMAQPQAQMPMAGLPQPGTVAVQPHPGILGNGLPGAAANAGPGLLPGMNPGGASVLSAMTSPSSNLPGLPMMQAQPAMPQLTPTGQQYGMTYEQLRAQGYTDDVLRQHGLIQ